MDSRADPEHESRKEEGPGARPHVGTFSSASHSKRASSSAVLQAARALTLSGEAKFYLSRAHQRPTLPRKYGRSFLVNFACDCLFYIFQ